MNQRYVCQMVCLVTLVIAPSLWGDCGDILAYIGATPARSNGLDTGTGDSCVDEKLSFGWGYQCVELVKRYYSEELGVDVSGWRGNANEYFQSSGEKGLAAYANGGAEPPATGDILAFSGGDYGHVALVSAVNLAAGEVELVEQNWSDSGVATLRIDESNGGWTIEERSNLTVQGWLRLPSLAGPPAPVGNDFQINDLEAGFQTAPDVTALLTGGFATVWLGPAPEDPSISAVLLRIFGPDGIPLTSDRRVSGLLGGTRANPKVAADAGGNVLVAWTENLDVRGRWCESDGDPLGEEFFINAFRFNGQQLPAIVAFGDRQAVAVWESLGAFQDVDGWSIKMRILGPSGPIDPGQDEDILVNLETVGSQVAPSIAMSNSGLIVAWAQQPGTIRARRFSVGGTGADHEIVDISAPAGSTQPVVAMTSDGGFVVGWSTGADLLARLYGPDDNPLGPEFSLGFLPGSSGLDLQADGSDSFISAVQGITSSLNDVFGRRFRPDGTAIGDPILLNSHTSLNQLGPAIGMNPAGTFIVVWESQTAPPGEDNDGTSIRGRLFELAPGSDP